MVDGEDRAGRGHASDSGAGSLILFRRVSLVVVSSLLYLGLVLGSIDARRHGREGRGAAWYDGMIPASANPGGTRGVHSASAAHDARPDLSAGLRRGVSRVFSQASDSDKLGGRARGPWRCGWVDECAPDATGGE